MTEKTALTCFDDFITNVAPSTVPEDRLFLSAGLIELLRRTKNRDVVMAMAQLLVELPDTNWSAIPFSLTRAVLGNKYHKPILDAGLSLNHIPEVLQTSIVLFLEFLQGGAEVTEEVFAAIVASVAADKAAALKPKQATPVLMRAPEVFQEKFANRVFTPAAVTEATIKQLRADYVYFKGELPGPRLGPDIRGLCFENGTNQLHILLETGEYVRVPTGALNVAQCNDPEEFKRIPPHLLLNASIAGEYLCMIGVIEEDQKALLASGCLGKLQQPCHKVVVAFETLQPLEQVFEKGRESISMGVTGPSGATVRFPVADTDMAVVIDARYSPTGAYGVSRLVRTDTVGDDTTLMRHDTPRQFTARGIYLFPTKDDGLVALTAIF
jgi:hypothetical protein